MVSEHNGQRPAKQAVPSAPMRQALRRADNGSVLSQDEATVLLRAKGADLSRLCAAAARARDAGLSAAGRAGIVTYSPNVFIPLTRLCRDRCHYCTFATVPHRLAAEGQEPFLPPDEVIAIARRGAELGCKEALFTLGDRPEDRWSAAADWLASRGFASTVDYVRAMSIRVLEETGLLPHLNPGVLTWSELQRLKPVSASMGMMLETTATRLWSEPGGCHHGSPDKEPSVRLRVLDDAGSHAIPFTTGILVGIGETIDERAEALFELRRIARHSGHVQEVIVQNFRAKPDTAMRTSPDADFEEYLAAIAVARLVLGPKVRVQAPPNLSQPDQLAELLAAGVDDWGGVSPVTQDHVNPERPWPHVDELELRTADAGYTLRERLTVHPEYVLRQEPWLDPRISAHVTALAEPVSGLARAGWTPAGLPWQEPDGGWESAGRTDLHTAIDVSGRCADRRADFDEVYGDWTETGKLARHAAAQYPTGSLQRADPEITAALRAAERNPAALSDAEAIALTACEGGQLEALCGIADDLRKQVVGDDVTYVINRNINFTNVCYTGCRFCAFAQRRNDDDAFTLSVEEVGHRAEEAWAEGATEVCMQGGIHPDLPGTAYFDLAAEIRRRVPSLHIHAFSPMEVVNGASRTGMSIRDWLHAAKESGVDSIPGTAAEILDEDVRRVLTKGKLPAELWIEVITTAHEVGLRSSSTMMYGHIDTPAHWVGHLRRLAGIQARTGGFSEFVALPFVHHNAPLYLAGIARPGPTMRENRIVHALARILLHGLIPNIQCSWVKLGVEGTQTMLRGGANDLGGTLMEETISRMAGSEHGSHKNAHELAGVAAGIGRPARQRTTLYERVPSRQGDRQGGAVISMNSGDE